MRSSQPPSLSLVLKTLNLSQQKQAFTSKHKYRIKYTSQKKRITEVRLRRLVYDTNLKQIGLILRIHEAASDRTVVRIQRLKSKQLLNSSRHLK